MKSTEDVVTLISLLGSAVFLIFAIVGAISEKRIRTKYNGAVGLVNSYLFTGGSSSGIMLLLMPFMNTEESNILGVLGVMIAGLVCVALAALILFLAWKKCPPGNNALFPLIVGMLLVGAAGALRIFAFLMKLVFRFDMFAGSKPGSGFASWYRNGAAEYQLWTANGNYAVLKGPDGSTFNVYPHGNDGSVCDDSSNIYYPL